MFSCQNLKMKAGFPGKRKCRQEATAGRNPKNGDLLVSKIKLRKLFLIIL